MNFSIEIRQLRYKNLVARIMPLEAAGRLKIDSESKYAPGRLKIDSESKTPPLSGGVSTLYGRYEKSGQPESEQLATSLKSQLQHSRQNAFMPAERLCPLLAFSYKTRYFSGTSL